MYDNIDNFYESLKKKNCNQELSLKKLKNILNY